MIQKRFPEINPVTNISLWLIPTMTYLMLKYVAQVTFIHEWVWWIVIPVMFTMWFLLNFKFGVEQKELKKVYDPALVFNVDHFNEWFNDKDNGATYAHSGIYLRLDKLSLSHVTEYLYNEWDLRLSQDYDYDQANEFFMNIRSNWFKQISEQNEKPL